MSEILEPRYDHQKHEKEIYELWEKSGYFNPDNLPTASSEFGVRSSKNKKISQTKPRTSNLEPFSIIMPPPNANGSLHLGHAVFVALQDILIRFWRMRGKKALWLPGADHAGFETQVVFDKKLEKEGRNRFTIPREELFKEIWDFTQHNKKIMEEQLRKLGASCDWSREKFTLDPAIIRIVYETFEKLYKDGLLYRDLRVVNWCPKHKTALSDLEVKHEERLDQLYYIKYGPLTLATVRPETKFGDTALAVNPKDKRYSKYIGKEIRALGLLGKLTFKVIADEAVDPKFGTGVIKVTPAHDPADFEIWQRHKKEIPGPKIIIDENGRLTGETGKFAGMKVAEARIKVAEAMKEIGILEKVENDYKHSVAVCYKCGNVLEPIPKMQWFIAMTAKPHQSRDRRPETGDRKKSLRDLGIEAVEKKKIKFYPAHSKKVILHWLKNIRDWNISRQIVWGIRIPVWYCLACSARPESNRGEPKININQEVKSRWFLVRHGETDWNKEGRIMGQSDIPLNKTGMAQAEEAARELKPHKVDLIISSDSARCRQTAEIIKKETGAEIILEKKLRERHHGDIEGLLRKDVFEQYPRIYEYSYEGKYMNAESYRELEERAWEVFSSHHSRHGHKNVVLITHGGTIRMLIKRIKNLTPEAALSIPSRKNAEIIQLDVLDKCENCGGHFYEQDPDVFDTWFSSGQWPFATLMTSDKKMGFHEEVVPQVLDGKTKTYRLRDHGFKVGDKVLFENSATKKIFGYGIITEAKKTTIDKIDYTDKSHYKTYKNLDELMTAFKHKNPEKTFTSKSPAYLYAYDFYPAKNLETDFETFYPTDVMETGYDILFFWVARMVMLGIYTTGKIPFRTVYLHGLVLDKDKKKMSKSKGNVIDPLGVAEIYGSDALRMALVAGNTAGKDIVISEDKIRGYRNFATKVWNISRFILMNKMKDIRHQTSDIRVKLTASDKKNIAEAEKIKDKVGKHIEKFEFHLAAETAYHYIWHTFADKIIEEYKPRLKAETGSEEALGGAASSASGGFAAPRAQAGARRRSERTADSEGPVAAYQTLEAILLECLKMLHPFMPFITEAIFQKLNKGEMLMIERW